MLYVSPKYVYVLLRKDNGIHEIKKLNIDYLI